MRRAGGRGRGRGGRRGAAPGRSARDDLYEAEEARDTRRRTADAAAAPDDGLRGLDGELPVDFDDESIDEDEAWTAEDRARYAGASSDGGEGGEGESDLDLDNGDADPWEQIERVQAALKGEAQPPRRVRARRRLARPSRASTAAGAPSRAAPHSHRQASARAAEARVDAFLADGGDGGDGSLDEEEEEEEAEEAGGRARMLRAAGVGVLTRKRKLAKARARAAAGGRASHTPRRWC